MTLMGSATRLARLLAAALLLVALFGDFLSPSPPDLQDLNQFFAPPSRIHFVDARGAFHWRPFVYRMQLTEPQDARYSEQTDQAFPLTLFCEGYSYRLLGVFPTSVHLVGTRPEGVFHPLGTDNLGRDVLSRSLAGAGNSMMVLLLGVAIYLVVGIVIGGLAGMAGGWADAVLMRFSEFVLALPALYLVLAMRALLPARMPVWQTILITAGTLASVTWPPMARGVRGLVMQTRNAAYAEAARSLGASPSQIFRRHMLPALAPFALAQAAVAAPVFILGDVILAFLNVGFQGTAVSWGAMLRSLTEDPRTLTDFWWNLAPLVLVFATLLCVNSLGKLRYLKDPKQLA